MKRKQRADQQSCISQRYKNITIVYYQKAQQNQLSLQQNEYLDSIGQTPINQTQFFKVLETTDPKSYVKSSLSLLSARSSNYQLRQLLEYQPQHSYLDLLQYIATITPSSRQQSLTTDKPEMFKSNQASQPSPAADDLCSARLCYWNYIFYYYSTTMSKPKNTKRPLVQQSENESESSVLLVQEKPSKKQQLQLKKTTKNTPKQESEQEQDSPVVRKKPQKAVKTQPVSTKKVVAPIKTKRPVKKSSSQEEEQSEEEPPKKVVKTKSPISKPTLLSKKKVEQSSQEPSDSSDVAPVKAKTSKVSLKANPLPLKTASKKPIKPESSQQSSQESSQEVLPSKALIKAKSPLQKVKSPLVKAKSPVQKPLVSKRKVQQESSQESQQQQKPKKIVAKKVVTKVESSEQQSQSEQKLPVKKTVASVKQPTIVKKIELPQIKQEKKQKVVIAKKEDHPKQQIDEQGQFSIFVKGLSFIANQNDVKDLFNPCGNVVSVKVLTREDGKSRGLAFVKFSSKASFNKALQLNATEHFAREINVEQSLPRPNKYQNNQKHSEYPQNINIESSTLFVGGLSFNSTIENITELFKKAGQVLNVKIGTDKQTGKPRGFAYVQFADVATAKQAYEKLNNQVLDGRRIRINNAVQREKTENNFGAKSGPRGYKNLQVSLSSDDKNAKIGSINTFQGKLIEL